MRRHSAWFVFICGAVALSVGVAEASGQDGPTFTVEPLPVPYAPNLDVVDLSPGQVRDGHRLVGDAVAKLVAQHPELARAVVSTPTPVYQEGASAPFGISVRLDLPSPVDVTIDLVRTTIAADGTAAPVALPSKITNLRGLVLDLSLETGQVISLYPAPYAADVHRPETATVVEGLNPEQYRLYPDGDQRGLEE